MKIIFLILTSLILQINQSFSQQKSSFLNEELVNIENKGYSSKIYYVLTLHDSTKIKVYCSGLASNKEISRDWFISILFNLLNNEISKLQKKYNVSSIHNVKFDGDADVVIFLKVIKNFQYYIELFNEKRIFNLELDSLKSPFFIN